MSSIRIPKQTLLRLPLYLNYLRRLPEGADEYISATKIAGALSLNHVVVRKDLATISSAGRPKVGYEVENLITELEDYLGYNDANDAIIVGAGRLGKALLMHEGFKDYGFNILAAFDVDETALEEEIPGKILLPMNKFMDFCERTKVRIGILTVPDKTAQAVANLMCECGILAIWNFTTVNLVVPENVLVQNENMAASMAVLSKHLSEKMQKKDGKNK